MKQIEIKADNPISEDMRAQTLKYLQDNLSDQELSRLGEIAKSKKARNYLNNKYNQVRFLFGLR